MNQFLQEALHITSQVFLIPVMAILVLFIVISIFSIGEMFMEYFMERRINRFNLEDFLKELNNTSKEKYKATIERSRLFETQKKSIHRLLEHIDLSKASVESIAQKLLVEQENQYNKLVSKTDLIAKLAPMLGLMGTLIPLGPGLLALGEGNTEVLSKSLLIAFDTTIAGLISASIAWVISRKRKSWYKSSLVDTMSIMEYLLEGKEDDEKANK